MAEALVMGKQAQVKQADFGSHCELAKGLLLLLLMGPTQPRQLNSDKLAADGHGETGPGVDLNHQQS